MPTKIEQEILATQQTIKWDSEYEIQSSQPRVLPKSIGRLTNLRVLYLSNTHLNSIPEEIGCLSNLKELDLYRTFINSLPDTIGNLVNLEKLSLRHTYINRLPESLKNLKKLKILDLGYTPLKRVPDFLCSFQNIEYLNLSGTQINTLPNTIGGMPCLKTLVLEDNVLSKLPESLLDLDIEFISDFSFLSLDKDGIFIGGLQLTEQPIEIFSQDRELIRAYYRSQDKVPINECKVVFLGDGGAGKTLMIERLMRNGEKIPDFDGESTPGICISSKKYRIGDEEIELHFWDFGGQAIMHSMHRLFLTNRTLYVVVTNARDNKANEQAWYWIRNIQSFANGAPVLLVINQKDQNPSVNINENGLRAEYPDLKGVQIISALKDTKKDFLSEVRDEICRIVSDMETVHTAFSKSWLSLMNDLQEMPKDYITSDEFYLKCQDNGVGTKAELLDQIIRWYQDLGVCFYSGKHPVSKQYMVLKPRWLLNALYILVFNGREYAKNGIISETDIHELICKKVSDENIKKVWPEIQYQPQEIQYIINVLLNFSLIYRLEPERFFIPMLCDENEPKEITSFNLEDVVHISFEYLYLPENVLHRFMVRHGYELNTNIVWRTGAIFERRQCGWTSLVRIRDNHLDIYATTENQKEHPINSYLDMMRESIYAINKVFGLHADEYIAYCKDGREDCFDYAMLVGCKNTGISQVYSKVFKQAINVDEILGIINRFEDRDIEEVIEQMLSVLRSMSVRSVDLYDLDEPALTSINVNN